MNGRAMFAFVIPLDGTPVDPGFGGGIGAQPGHPSQGLPGSPGHPSQGLPWQPGHPSQGLPGAPGHPSQGLPWGPGHPGNALPVPPVRPDHPITLPPGIWPPQLPPGANVPDHELPPGQPIFIPPDPSLGIEQPIVLPTLPPGTALLIALGTVNLPTPTGAPSGAKPAILVQPGKRPVLVYVSASGGGAQPK
jgi:hypothetical protein